MGVQRRGKDLAVKRVIIVTPDIVGPVKNGGIGTACYHYARVLAAAGHAVEILFAGWALEPDEIQRWTGFYADLGIAFHALNEAPRLEVGVLGFKWYSETSWRILQWLKDRPAEVVLFQDWKAEGFWPIRAKQAGLAFAQTTLGVIVHSPSEWQAEGMRTFGSDALFQADLEACERAAIAEADVVITPSRYMADWLRARDFALPARVEVCPIPLTDNVEPLIDRPIDRSHLVFFGRLETRKGLALLGEALALLKAAGRPTPAKVSLVGKHGEVGGRPSALYVDRLRQENPEVEFAVETDLDYRAARDYLIVANGVVVLPSLLDNFPLTVLESIQQGFPLLVADTGGVPEMVDPRALFAPEPKALAAKLAEVPQFDFAYHHPYDAKAAADTWRAAIDGLIAAPAAPAIGQGAIPPISVCIPFYRHDRYVRRLVGAFQAMALPALQLLIVDDGTPQGERTDLAALEPELRAAGHIVLHQANAGPGAARNAAVAAARHDTLIFFDADNTPFPDMAAKLWRAMENTGADSVAAPFFAVPPMLTSPVLQDALWAYIPCGLFTALSLYENTLGDMTAMVRRKAVEAAGGFETRIGKPAWEDWEFFLRLIAAGRKHLVYPEPLVFYTDHPNREKTPEFTHALRVSLFNQLDRLDPKMLLRLTKTLAAQGYVLKDAGRW